ncbi:hypothetical protein KKG85_01530 [Patescibacteria group bacterium]|nr:hypothetical protein [Patescibacteria group bacterium]MBU2579758.1 hypothetical protein [Patescibacteria group bacterium]
MTTRKFVVTDEQEKIFHKRRRELENRFFKGALNPEDVNQGLQMLIEGRKVIVFKEKPNIPALIVDWRNFYSELGIEADFSNLQIPNKQKGFDHLIIVAKEMTPQLLYDKCEELFPCWKWTDKNLDEIVESERTAKNGAYAIWVRDRVEADEELKNLSADDLKNKNIPGITLEERLIHELKYFKETGKHLDRDNVTLCAGSRYSDGHVPGVDWYGGRLEVGWRSPDRRGGFLRARRAVS